MLIKFELKKINSSGLQFRILEQKESLRCAGLLTCRYIDGLQWSIRSMYEPDINDRNIYLRGSVRERDNVTRHIYFNSDFDRNMHYHIILELFNKLKKEYEV